MVPRPSFTYRCRSWAAAGFCLVLLAASGEGALAACKLKSVQFGPATVEGMREHPEILLINYPQGGFGMQSAVAELATHGAPLIEALRTIFRNANREQNKYIGFGMADAAKACLIQDADIAQSIRDVVKGGVSSALKQAFVISMEAIDTDSGPPPSIDAPPQKPLAPTVSMDLGTSSSRAPLSFPDPFGSVGSWH